MRKIIFYFAILLTSFQIDAQNITETGGWLESAFVKWTPVTGADSYNVYYSGGGLTNIKIDTQLIRSYGTYFRADILGLKAGIYTITIKSVTAGVEGAGTTTSNITVIAHDRTGFAFDSGRVPGGYKADGTPKTGAVILYITEKTKNTISMVITGANSNPCVGLQNILDGIKKGNDTRPFIIRLIGNISNFNVMLNGDIVIENAQNANSYVTLEGVGSDAVANGWGIRIKSATNIEINNLGFMLTDASEGDNVGLQQDNDHIWVHNCDMYYGSPGGASDQVKGDGAMDCKKSTYCTFSYNHFWDSGKSNLLGLSENTKAGLYVTYHHNWYDHSDSRHPRVRFYSAHVYNNYFDGNSKYGAGSTLGSSVFMEGNFFRNCKYPMLTSMQGTDVYNGALGTFSSEDGGTIKAFNNSMIGQTRYIPYNASTYPIEFDAIETATRDEVISSTIKSKQGANSYNNFDTDPALYIKNLTIDDPTTAKNKVIQYSGRVSGGDLKWTFDNTVDDISYDINAALKTALTTYTSQLVYIQGEVILVQTLLTTTNNNQTVTSGTPITDMIFTWGGTATDANATDVPAGLSIVKNVAAQTITLNGTPTASGNLTITTTGSGTAATATGLITVTLSGNQILTLSSSANNSQTVAGGIAITPIVYTWGGDASDTSLTGLPSGLSSVKDMSNKTLTISGTPTSSGDYSVATSGSIGIPATGTGTITVLPTGDQIHDFTASGKTSTFYTFGATANLSTTKGTITYNGLTLTQCLKIESATTITYTTTQASTLTLVMNTLITDPTAQIKVDGIIYTDASGIITIPIAAGTHTLTRNNAANLYFIKTSYTTLGLDQKVVTPTFSLYPNPVSDLLYLSATDQKIENVIIYSMTGALVKTVSNRTDAIDVSDLNSGNYLVKLITDQGSYIQRVIKK
jgi:pectate lyase